MLMTARPAVATFMTCAEAYCHAVRQLATESSTLPELQRALAHLCAAAFDLPSVAEPCTEEDLAPERLADATLAGLPVDSYWETLEPFRFDAESQELGIGSIVDDLLDIDADIAHGIALYRAGHSETAAWIWRSSFWAHWGAHAVSAQRALFWATARGPV